MQVLPAGACDGLRFFQTGDQEAMAFALLRAAGAGQCDIERSSGQWARTLADWNSGWIIVDRPRADGPARGYFHFTSRQTEAGRQAVVSEQIYENPQALMRQLRFLSSLRDQYSQVVFTLPVDLPLNLILREAQIAPNQMHNHPTAALRIHNRMQLRVLDHKRLLEAIPWPKWAKGKTVICVQESEGHSARFEIDVSDGHANVTPTTAIPEAAISDNTWAQIATGVITASKAAAMGLIAAESVSCLALLDALAKGPAPFCHEGF
jgi:predicted acetyltransferase